MNKIDKKIDKDFLNKAKQLTEEFKQKYGINTLYLQILYEKEGFVWLKTAFVGIDGEIIEPE